MSSLVEKEFAYFQARLSPALDQRESLEACSTPTVGSCPPSGWPLFKKTLLAIAPVVLLESQDAQEVMLVTESVCE